MKKLFIVLTLMLTVFCCSSVIYALPPAPIEDNDPDDTEYLTVEEFIENHGIDLYTFVHQDLPPTYFVLSSNPEVMDLTRLASNGIGFIEGNDLFYLPGDTLYIDIEDINDVPEPYIIDRLAETEDFRGYSYIYGEHPYDFYSGNYFYEYDSANSRHLWYHVQVELREVEIYEVVNNLPAGYEFESTSSTYFGTYYVNPNVGLATSGDYPNGDPTLFDQFVQAFAGDVMGGGMAKFFYESAFNSYWD